MSLTEIALKLSKSKLKLKVFPTGKDKAPAWSNKDLIAAGYLKDGDKGGLYTATTSDVMIKLYFEHRAAFNIGVPCRDNGLLVVDVDLYKEGAKEWYEENKHLLETTLSHSTPGGGLHFVFKDPGGKLPRKLHPAVDLQSNHYVNWAGVGGYEVRKRKPVVDFPLALLDGPRKKLKAKANGKGHNRPPSERAQHEDDILEGVTFHEAMTVLSAVYVSDGLSEQEIYDKLDSLVESSRASKPSHERHERWLGIVENERNELLDCVTSAVAKFDPVPAMEPTPEMLDAIDQMFAVDPAKPEPPAAEPPPTEGLIPLDDVIAAKDTVAPEWLLGEEILLKQLNVIGGAGGVGKSTMTITMALEVTQGIPVIHDAVHHQGNVLIVNNEDPASAQQRRFSAVREALKMSSSPYKVFVKGAPEQEGQRKLVLAIKDRDDIALQEDVFQWLEEQIRATGALLVIIDPFISVIRGAVSNDNDAVHEVAERLRLVAFRTGAAVVAVAHTRKQQGNEEPDADQLRGASSLRDTARAVVMLSRPSKKAGQALDLKEHHLADFLRTFRRLDLVKGNFSEELGSAWLEMTSYNPGDGSSIGVLKRIGSWDALKDRLRDRIETPAMAAMGLATMIVDTMAPGKYSTTQLVNAMKEVKDWPYKSLQRGVSGRLLETFKDGVNTISGGSVTASDEGKQSIKFIVSKP